MKKHADKKKQPMAHVPAYCPLELYSPDPERVKRALYALWDDWVQSDGTINMLRIFANGKVLNPNDVHTVSLPDSAVRMLTPSASFRSHRLRSSLRKLTLTTPSPLTHSLPTYESNSWKQ